MNTLLSGANDIKNLYFFIGRPKPWETPYNDNNPEPATSDLSNEYQCHMDMMALKKLDVGENLTYCVPRYDWVYGTVYAMYDDADTDLYNHPSTADLDAAALYLSTHPSDPYTPGSYYVVTDEWEVYMCLSNGFGGYGTDGLAGKSTVKPTGGSLASGNRYIVEGSDGYRWKYLYTLSQNDIDKYVTESWIPVRHLTSNDLSDQWLVQIMAENLGAIDTIKLYSSGTRVAWYGNQTPANYGIGAPILAGGDNTQTYLDPSYIPSYSLPTTLTNVNDLYTGSQITCVRASDGAIETRRILSYVVTGGNNIVTICDTVDPTIAGTWGYKPIAASGDLVYIAPRAVISGNVSDPAAICTVNCLIDNSVGSSNGTIKEIVVSNPGTGYRLATIAIYGKNETISDPNPLNVVARPIIPTGDGLGSNPKMDLGAWNVMLTTNFNNLEGNGDFPVANDYRRMGLIRDIYDYNTSVYSTSPTLRACAYMTVDNTTDEFEPDEIIQVLNGPDVVTSAIVIESSAGSVKYYQDTSTGFVPFETGQQITGVTSTTEAGIVALFGPEYEPYSGYVLYIEQRKPIVRSPEQQESIRVIVTF